MNTSKLRRQIAWEAACLMYRRQESEYFRAKQKAARRICRGWVKPADLPSNAEIRDEVQSLARLYEGEQRTENLLEMRLEALRMMRLLRHCRPRLIGSVRTGHVRRGSDIDIHLFVDRLDTVTRVLDQEGMVYDVEHKRVRKQDQERIYTHIHVRDRFPIEMTVYASNQAHVVFKSSITGKAIERANIDELEALITREYPQLGLTPVMEELENRVDRFQIYEALLLPLENVKQSRRYHPEGDALYHSLQVFDLACDELPYDEEFLLAALLHDVGKAIDPDDHVAAGLAELEGFITDRTAWLIRHHMQGNLLLDGTLGARARRRLQQSEDYEDLLRLCQCDRDGRQVGVQTSDLDDALDYIRNLDEMFGI